MWELSFQNFIKLHIKCNICFVVMQFISFQIDNASLGKDTLVPAIKVYVAENKNWKLKELVPCSRVSDKVMFIKLLFISVVHFSCVHHWLNFVFFTVFVWKMKKQFYWRFQRPYKESFTVIWWILKIIWITLAMIIGIYLLMSILNTSHSSILFVIYFLIVHVVFIYWFMEVLYQNK